MDDKRKPDVLGERYLAAKRLFLDLFGRGHPVVVEAAFPDRDHSACADQRLEFRPLLLEMVEVGGVEAGRGVDHRGAAGALQGAARALEPDTHLDDGG